MAAELRNLCGGYGGKQIVNDVSMRLENGKTTCIIGPNGCGKSTLLQLCCGILKPSSGSIILDGNDITSMKRGAAAKKISYLPQSHNIGSISVRSLVSHGRFPYLGYPRRCSDEDKKIIEEAMALTDIADIAGRNMSELSGGQQQRAYVAMLLAQDTQTVLLDEPATYLDIRYRLELSELIRLLADKGKAVAVVMHDINEALSICDYAAVMNDGRIVCFASAEESVTAVSTAFGVRISGKKGSYYFSKEKRT